jgi:hypothetical protein
MTRRWAAPGSDDKFRLQRDVNTDGMFQKAGGVWKLVKIIQEGALRGYNHLSITTTGYTADITPFHTILYMADYFKKSLLSFSPYDTINWRS